MEPILELHFRRTSVHLKHDVKRLEDGEDLNDALMDFFVKLGQFLIPSGGLTGGFPAVAYLGSLFYDVLHRGSVKDGREGHANVANWARRRLGKSGLFADGVGALAVPVNEILRDEKGHKKGKHWWLALLLNPRGGARPKAEEGTGLLCLDSFSRAEVVYEPRVRSLLHGTVEAYPVEVSSLSRGGFCAHVRFRTQGDGSAGALADPKKSRMYVGDECWTRPDIELTVNQQGDHGKRGAFVGSMEFQLDASVRTGGDFFLEFGGPEAGYSPRMRLHLERNPSPFQHEVAKFLGGYLEKEWDLACKGGGTVLPYDPARVKKAVRLPDVPQQENANDCGYFILEQILQALQLAPDSLRALSTASTEELTRLPWPPQRQVATRKAKLREGLAALFAAARMAGTNDVETLLNGNPELRQHIQATLWEGPGFEDAVGRWIASGPRPEFTMAEMNDMGAKALRSTCVLCGVLPQGTVEREDLVKALTPYASDSPCPAPKPKPPEPKPKPKPAAPEPPKPKAEAVPQTAPDGSLEFTAAELFDIPTKRLRALCMHHGVLPSSAVEREDFILALAPKSKDARKNVEKPKEAPKPVPKPEPPTSMEFKLAELDGIPTKRLRTLCMHHGVLPSCAVEREDFIAALAPKAKDAPRAAEKPQPTTSMEFMLAELDDVPMQRLKTLCMHHGVLPPDAVDREDFILALAPKSRDAPKKIKEQKPKAQPLPTPTPRPAPEWTPRAPVAPPVVSASLSSFLTSSNETARNGAAPAAKRPPPTAASFSHADLESMTSKQLRTLCIQHGVLPKGSVDRSDLVDSLRPLAAKAAAAPRPAPSASAPPKAPGCPVANGGHEPEVKRRRSGWDVGGDPKPSFAEI